MMINWERERESQRGSVRKGSWQKVVIMGKDKKTKKRDQRERERGVDSWVGVVCLCVCGVWLWRGGFLFFSFVLYGGER